MGESPLFSCCNPPEQAHSTTTTTTSSTTTQEETNCCIGAGWKHGRGGGSSNHPQGPFGQNTDSELAKEMNELSVEEREKVFDEIHGVAEFAKEAPEFVESCIERLDKALADHPRNRRRKAFDRAKFLMPSLETDVAFKLMFLRADYYDAVKAARRIVKYFDDKLKLFGEDKLVKKISLDDLSPEDLTVLHSGFYMVPLPHPDNSGRPVWFCDLTKYDFDYPDSLVRCTWYVVMATLEEEVTQMKGVVNITYYPGSLKFNPSSIAKVSKATMKVGDMIVNLPCRESSFHFCYSDHGMEYFLSTMRRAFGKHIRLRIREHFGSDIEMRYSLMPFGIDCPLFVFNSEHSAEKLEYFRRYLQLRLLKDREENRQMFEESSKTGIVPYPSPNDILVGRGCPYQNFSGNRVLSHLIDTQYMDKYRQPTDRFGKTCMFMDVVKTIQNSRGGRFLERSTDGWKIVDDKVARDKVSSSFRSKVQKSSNTITTTSLTASSASTAGATASSSFAVVAGSSGDGGRHADVLLRPQMPSSSSSAETDCGADDPNGNRAKRLRYDTSVMDDSTTSQ